MRSDRLFLVTAISLLTLAVTLPAPASARPKSSWQSCTFQDLNTTFGKSCLNQMQQDVAFSKPYTHTLFCGGDTTLCCTVSNDTGEVIGCRKPAGSGVMPGMQGNTLGAGGMAGVQRRGVETMAPAPDEEAPVPSTLTPEIVKELLHKPAPK